MCDRGITGVCFMVCIIVRFAIKYDHSEDNEAKRRYMCAYKSVDFLFGAVSTAGLIYGREDIDFEETFQVVIIILVTIDVVLDPIQPTVVVVGVHRTIDNFK